MTRVPSASASVKSMGTSMNAQKYWCRAAGYASEWGRRLRGLLALRRNGANDFD
jgi:hypothetical protein